MNEKPLPNSAPAIAPGVSAAPRRRWLRVLTRLLVLAVCSYGLYGCTLVTFQDRLIFPREIPGKRDAGAPLPAGWEAMSVTIADGAEAGASVPCWLRVPRNRPEGTRVPLVIWFHGNAEVIDDVARYQMLAVYERLGVAVLIVEFRGYGRAQGAPSEKAITADSVKMYDLAVARPEIDADRVVFYGRSLGGGVACAVATVRVPKAMILQSTFTSINAMAARFYIPGFLVRHPFRNDRVIAALDAPVLVLHGTKDTIVPFSHGQALSKLAKNGTLLTQPCDHNDYPTDQKAYDSAIEDFLRKNGIVR